MSPFFQSTVLLVLCVALAACDRSQTSQEQVSNESSARLRSATNRIELGTIEEKTIVPFTFSIFNDGNAPLTISGVRPSCGCTDVVIGQQEVAPGQSTEISGRFDSALQSGSQEKSLKIFSNDPGNPAHTVTLAAEVVNTVKWNPRTVEFLSAELSQSTSTIMEICGWAAGGKFQITDCTVTSAPQVSARVLECYAGTADEALPEAGWGCCTVEVTHGTTDRPGYYAGALNLETNLKNYPTVQVPVSGQVNGLLQAIPNQLVFGMLSEPSVPISFKIESKNQVPFHITKIESTNDLADLTPQSNSDETQHQLAGNLRFSSDVSFFEGEIRISTSLGEAGLIIIPVSAVLSLDTEASAGF